MPKWITCAFALFLSLQVFSTKGQDVDHVINKHLAAMGRKGVLKFKETIHTNHRNSEPDYVLLLINYKSMGHAAKLVGKENLNGKECYQVKLILLSGGHILYDIDAATWFIMRQTSFTPQGAVISRNNTDQIY